MLSKNTDPSQEDIQFLDIAVLAGGVSAEREVSLESGQAVVKALNAHGHFATMIDPSIVDLYSLNWRAFDVCFVALHGGEGENGKIQLQLEEIGIPYTGSSPVAARLAMSKVSAKERFTQHNIPTPRWQTIRATSPADQILDEVESIGFPAIIKPDNQGSSLGVSIANTADDVADAVQEGRQYESFLVAERMIAGREFTVAVLDGEPLPVLEIDSGDGVFNYHSKKAPAPGSVHPLKPNDKAAQKAAKVAVEAAAALGTCGLVRVDVIVDEQEQPWVLELNAVPGLTEQSLAPLAARYAGLNMSDLCNSMVRGVVALKEAA